jgi:biopolymer transport protein ExbD
MKISGKRDYVVNLESCAMTDIVLNMFIFFFISFSLLYTFNPDLLQKLAVNLPQAKNTKPAIEAPRLNIVITKEGIIYLDKNAVTLDELSEKIDDIHGKSPNISILLSADKTAQFKYFAGVLDILSNFDIKNINIAVERDL